MFFEPKRGRGFTLIELLVVIAIIGILASIVLVSLTSARAKARDTKRIATLKQVQTALELYASDHQGTYPGSANVWYDNTCTADDGPSYPNFTSFLTGYYNVPSDPNGAGCIWYISQPSGSTGGPVAGNTYALLVFPEDSSTVAKGQGCYNPTYYCVAVK